MDGGRGREAKDSADRPIRDANKSVIGGLSQAVHVRIARVLQGRLDKCKIESSLGSSTEKVTATAKCIDLGTIFGQQITSYFLKIQVTRQQRRNNETK